MASSLSRSTARLLCTAARRATLTTPCRVASTPPLPTTFRMSLSTTTVARSLSSFDPHPSPPRLPPEEQAEFEKLLQEAADSDAAAALADAVAANNAAAAAAEAAKSGGDSAAIAKATAAAEAAKKIHPKDEAGTPIDGVWRGAPPEFEGDKNPVTGEVGGPKNEPLRWGSQGDWSFNGRVTDF